MNLELYIDRVEAYETGTLSADERAAFERDLAADTGLRQALELYRTANDALEVGIENRLREQLQSWAAEEAGPARTVPINDRRTTPVVGMRSRIVRWAAAAVVLALVGWFGWHTMQQRYSDPALFAAHYEAPTPASMRAGSTTEHPLQPGFEALERGQPGVAAAFFELIPAGSERYAEARYFLGHAALQEGRYDLAIDAFRIAAAAGDIKFAEKAEWNLALTYVAAGRTSDPELNALLTRIAATPDHSYAGKASALKRRLGSTLWR